MWDKYLIRCVCDAQEAQPESSFPNESPSLMNMGAWGVRKHKEHRSMVQKISFIGLMLIFSGGPGFSAGVAQQKAAIGFYLNTSNNISPLSYTTANGGNSWSLSKLLPLPGDVVINVSQANELRGLACDGPGRICSAVGFYSNNKSNIAPLGYTTANGGVSWSLSGIFPLPNNVAANGIQNTQLQDVACDSTGKICCAVGFYLNSNNNLVPLSYRSSNAGAAWLLGSAFPLPRDVASNGIQNTELNAVNCDNSGSYCTAVGFYLNNGNNITPLSYTTVNGGATWSLSTTLPLPADMAANGSQNSALLGVS